MIGSNLQHYRILSRLGGGGMGVVYEAEDTRLGRRVAVKVLPAEMAGDTMLLERFNREARVVASLNHPNIVTIYAVEENGGVPFLAMELIEGEPLNSRIVRGGLPADALLEIAIPLADALVAAHERGIIHRDLKPANILFGKDGRLRVLDFGLAKLREELAPTGDATAVRPHDLTEVGTVLGTVPYMSPEQVQAKPIDHRSDIFSFGVILYELATGERPFRGESSADLISSILRDKPRDVTEARLDLPDHVGRVVRRCLEKDPARRFQSALELRLALDEVQGALGTADTKRLPSVAVLAFADMSAEKDQDYFCEGIAEELINGLGRIENLRVASRTSSFQFKGTSLDVREIGHKLEVSTILEGSVRKAGNRLRITAQLVNVADGYRLWSDRFDRDMKDIFAIQDEIAESIVAALELKLSPRERRALQNVATRDVEAYDFYLRGRKFFYQMSQKSLQFARQMYAKAIEVDPTYALAYAGLADCSSFIYQYFEASEANLQAAQAAAAKALELDPDLPEAYASRGLALSLGGDYEEAEKQFDEAQRLNPRLYEASYFRGRNALSQGHFAKARDLFIKASEVRPDDFQAPTFVRQALLGLGATKEELEEATRGALGKIESHVSLNPDDARALYLGGGMLLSVGEKDRGLEWARRALSIDPGDPLILYNVACVFSQAGEIEQSIRMLERAVEAGFGHRKWIEHDSDLDHLRKDPRFVQLLARM